MAPGQCTGDDYVFAFSPLQVSPDSEPIGGLTPFDIERLMAEAEELATEFVRNENRKALEETLKKLPPDYPVIIPFP